MGRAGNAVAGLTPKQEVFAVNVAMGMTGADAYRGAYEPKNMAAKTVHEKASRLLAQGKIRARVMELRAPALRKAELSVERTLLDVARLSTSDLRRLLDDGGCIKPPSEWDDDIAPAVAAVSFDKDTGRVTSVKLWDKNAALAAALRHLGLFERDNRQRAENLAIQINLVGSLDDSPPET